MWQIDQVDGVSRASFVGDNDTEGDADGAHDFNQAVEEALKQLHAHVSEEPKGKWLVDFEGITYISSLAIAQLIATVRVVDVSGGSIVLARAHSFVKTVLQTMRIVKVLPMYDSLDDAKAQLLS